MPRALQEVVFVDGVRTPFGKAGEKGMYAQTRADDLVIKCIRELLRRHPELPKDRVEEVAIAATTQIGDQGLTLGRLAALLSGLPNTTPGYSIDRMCAGAMTAVTNVASLDRRSARSTSPSPAASSTWAATRWARASTPTRGSSPSSSSTSRPW